MESNSTAQQAFETVRLRPQSNFKGGPSVTRNMSKIKARLGNMEKKWCLGCDKNLSCFVHRNYEKLLHSKNKEPNFSLEYHFYPQSWFCSFYSHINNYTILKFPTDDNQYGDFYKAIGKFLRAQNVPSELVEKIEKKLATKRTFHSTTGTKESRYYRNWLFRDKTLLEIVVKTYFHDFTTFGFELPRLWEVKLCTIEYVNSILLSQYIHITTCFRWRPFI